jgi:hypothetical protein
MLAMPAVVHAQEDPALRGPVGFGAAEAGGSWVTAAVDRSAHSLTGHYGVRAGVRVRQWGVALRLEQTFWRTPERARVFVQSAINLAVGVDHLYAAGRLRSGVDVGVSVLARDNAIDAAGKTGLFLDVRPVGVRWRLGELVTVGFEPLHLALVAPVLRGIPLLDVQFRSTLYVEVGRAP